MDDFDLGESSRQTLEQKEAQDKHDMGQSIKQVLNKQNEFELTRPKVEILSEPCESCSA